MQQDPPASDDLNADLQRRLAETQRELDQERERADSMMREHQSLRGELAALRKQLDVETQAHARARQGHDLVQGKLKTLEGTSDEHKREAQRQASRADQAGRDLEAARRELGIAQVNLRNAEQAVAELQGAATEVAAARASLATALEALRRRFPADVTVRMAPFLLGRVAIELARDTKAAAGWFETYLREQPSGALAEEARARLMEIWNDGPDMTRAQEVARDYLRYHANGEHSGLARRILAER